MDMYEKNSWLASPICMVNAGQIVTAVDVMTEHDVTKMLRLDIDGLNGTKVKPESEGDHARQHRKNAGPFSCSHQGETAVVLRDRSRKTPNSSLMKEDGRSNCLYRLHVCKAEFYKSLFFKETFKCL